MKNNGNINSKMLLILLLLLPIIIVTIKVIVMIITIIKIIVNGVGGVAQTPPKWRPFPADLGRHNHNRFCLL